MNDSFLIQSISPCPLDLVQLIHDANLDQFLPDHLLDQARAQWKQINRERQSQGKPPLLDLPQFRPGSIRYNKNQIQIPCGTTSYLVATFLSGKCSHWDKPYTGAGLSIVPVCANNQILIGRRSGIVHQGRDLFHVAAGHAHPKPNFQTKPDTLTEAVLQELDEEMAIQLSDIKKMDFLGIGLNRITSKTEFLTCVWLKEKADIYINRWEEIVRFQQDNEFDELTTIADIIGSDTFESHKNQFTIACQMALKAHWEEMG